MSKSGLKKKCSHCRRSKNINKFCKDKNRKYGRHTWCKKCKSKYDMDWYLKNRGRLLSLRRKHYQENIEEMGIKDKQRWKQDKRKNAYYKRTYGITLKKYNKMIEQQKGCCALCGRHYSELKSILEVDHNHLTLHIRGLLCKYCNGRVLRYFKDNKKIWKGFIKYAQKALKEDKDWR